MNRLYPQGDTPETLEGNAAHWVAWELLAGRPVIEGTPTPNGAVVTEEMVDGAELLVDTVRALVPDGLPLNIEQRTAISRVHPECFGTPDIWAFDCSTYVLDVIDYKFGHRFVDEYENDQCITYTAGIIDHLAHLLSKGPGMLDQAVKVRMTIIQPRCYYKGEPVRTWTVNAADLRAHINILANAAAVAMGPNPPAVTNSECQDCPGRHACPSLQRAAYSDAETATRSGPQELPPAAASLELRMLERALERLQSRVEGLREAVTMYGRQGHATPFHALQQGGGRQQWTMPVDQVLAMGQLMGVDLSKPGVKTPAQAKKAGVDESVIKAYSITPMGSVKLTPVNPADARRVFGSTK